MASAFAASRAFSREREAIATTVESSPRCIAGTTFLTAIPATPSTPQRTLPFACAPAMGGQYATRGMPGPELESGVPSADPAGLVADAVTRLGVAHRVMP